MNLDYKGILQKHVEKILEIEINWNEIPAIEKTNKNQVGDLSIACFNFAKLKRQSPMQIAQELKEKLEEEKEKSKDLEFIKEISVVGGYVNIVFDKVVVEKDILKQFAQKGYIQNVGFSKENEGKVVLIDYSSPNIAKQFHIGHLKTTLIGSMLYRLFKQLGYSVVGINHLGDYGTQFGKLIEGYNLWKDEYTFEKPLEDLNDIYIRINALCKEDENVLKKCRDNFKALENNDPEMVKIWKKFIELSLEEFEKTYKTLGVTFDSYMGESAYSSKMKEVTKLLDDNNLTTISQDAKIVDFGEDSNLPVAIIEKSNGSSMYITRDIAAFLYRKDHYDFEKLIYVVASEQIVHFKQLFKIMEMLGVDKKYVDGAIHLPYGMVSLPEGKMSTRLGNVIKVDDLLNEAVNTVSKVLEEKKSTLSKEEKEDIAKKVGIGAVIFSNLQTTLIKDQVFIMENVLDTQGDTAPYIQYTYTRINTILKNEKETYGTYSFAKADEIVSKVLKENSEYFANTQIYELLKHLMSLEETLYATSVKLEPSILTSYILTLAKLFNKIYNDHRMLVDNQTIRDFNCLLLEITAKTLEKTMGILGIQMPEQM